MAADFPGESGGCNISARTIVEGTLVKSPAGLPRGPLSILGSAGRIK